MSWTSTKRSGTTDYPTPRDLIVGLIGQLVAGNHFEAWVHFELEKRTGKISRLFAAIEESVEVALTKERFELNKGKHHLAIPSSWCLRRDGIIHVHGIIHVPLAEQESLVRWIDSYFQPLLAEHPNYTMKGWLDGL